MGTSFYKSNGRPHLKEPHLAYWSRIAVMVVGCTHIGHGNQARIGLLVRECAWLLMGDKSSPPAHNSNAVACTINRYYSVVD